MQCCINGAEDPRGLPVLFPWFIVRARTSLGNDGKPKLPGKWVEISVYVFPFHIPGGSFGPPLLWKYCLPLCPMPKHFLKSHGGVLGSFVIGCPWALILVLSLSRASFQTPWALCSLFVKCNRISASFSCPESQRR